MSFGCSPADKQGLAGPAAPFTAATAAAEPVTLVTPVGMGQERLQRDLRARSSRSPCPARHQHRRRLLFGVQV